MKSFTLMLLVQVMVITTMMVYYVWGCPPPQCCRMDCWCQNVNITSEAPNQEGFRIGNSECTCANTECPGSFITECMAACAQLVDPGVSSDEEFPCGCYCKMPGI